MQVRLADFLQGTADGEAASDILGRCVHCGFCTATCPTYQLLGDELDGPRGRLFLIKQVIEGSAPTVRTQLHLDRCLGCRACETTCPSGVEYGRLLDIGRRLVGGQVRRPAGERWLRAALKEGLPGPLFSPAMRLGQALRGLLPAALKAQVPERRDPGAWPARPHARKVLMLAGCVQPSMQPSINAATARVLDALCIETVAPGGAGCCGAIRQHLDDGEGALADARRNIDAWWPAIEDGADAIVLNASGCGSQVKDYGHLLSRNPAYAAKARRVSDLACDLAELLAGQEAALKALAVRAAGRRVAFHAPCSLQHGQRVRGVVESILTELGAEVVPVAEAHLCCGSAGTYSVLQPALSHELRDRRLVALTAARPEAILSANIGCIVHLGAKSPVPVRHWIEWLDEHLARA